MRHSIISRDFIQTFKKTALCVTLGFAALMTGCASLSSHELATSSTVSKANKHCLTECSPRLGIMAAFGQEAELLLAQMQDKSTVLINGKSFTTGTLRGVPVVLVLSGISMSNAVMTSQLLFDHYNVRQLVFSGIAGGTNSQYHVGDVVVAQSWLAPNEVYYANSTAVPAPCGKENDLTCLGLKLMPDVPPYADGIFLRETNVLNAKNSQQEALIDTYSGKAIVHGEMRSDYPVDPQMLVVANGLKATTTLEPICTSPTSCRTPNLVMGRRGISSGAFLANAKYRDYLEKNVQADCVDMETAGVAHVAYANQIPFIAFRSLSDLAGADANPDVGAFFASGVAQRNSAKLTMAFVEAWAPNVK
ncbi:5'-methylthioadenosine/S-adenosylhomocysteine nucleosidase [Aquirhabdus sp.]|uniref:5'-methylthioadenosine/S-adenosylhomocysteine nucleosidase n=1 Tax=Aquirhabdus sp. TaxID=2824160 RepID=UPI00396C9C1A